MKWQQHKAKQAKDWVRQEMKLHGESAKDFSLASTGIANEREMHALIIQTILSKYAIYHPKSGRPSKITKLAKDEIIKLTDGAKFSLPVYENRHNELSRTYDYLVKNSGLISFLAKVYWLWGKEQMLDVSKLLISESLSFIEYLEELSLDDRTSNQAKFFGFIEKFQLIHPDYSKYSAGDWIKVKEKNHFNIESTRKRVEENIRLNRKASQKEKQNRRAINKSIGRHHRKLSKRKGYGGKNEKK